MKCKEVDYEYKSKRKEPKNLQNIGKTKVMKKENPKNFGQTYQKSIEKDLRKAIKQADGSLLNPFLLPYLEQYLNPR